MTPENIVYAAKINAAYHLIRSARKTARRLVGPTSEQQQAAHQARNLTDLIQSSTQVFCGFMPVPDQKYWQIKITITDNLIKHAADGQQHALDAVHDAVMPLMSKAIAATVSQENKTE